MSPHDRCGEMNYLDFSTSAICVILCTQFILWTVWYFIFLRFTLFCHKILFVAIYALLREEKLNQKLCLWRKMTNIRYALWLRVTKFTRHNYYNIYGITKTFYFWYVHFVQKVHHIYYFEWVQCHNYQRMMVINVARWRRSSNIGTTIGTTREACKDLVSKYFSSLIFYFWIFEFPKKFVS